MSKAKSPLPSDLLLSLSTAPVLLGIVSLHALGRLTVELGEVSEELLRGDRLPVLHFHSPDDATDG